MRFQVLAFLFGAVAGANTNLRYQTTPAKDVAQFPMTDKSPEGFLFRGDSRAPEVIFKEGFHPFRGHYLLDTSQKRFVSLTRRATTAISYSNGHHAGFEGRKDEGFVFVLSPEGIKDRPAYWLPEIDKRNGWKFELAIDGSIEPETIVGAYSFSNLGTQKPKLKKWIANPGYKYQNESPFNPKGDSCWAKSCAGIRHLASAVCNAIGSCFKPDEEPDVQAKPEDPKENPGLCKRGRAGCGNSNAKEPENNGPTVEKGEDGELIVEAEQRSKESFDGLLEEFNYGSVVKQDKLYNELSTRLPKFSAPRAKRIAGFTAKIGEGALAIAGLALYGKAVADVFSSDASVLDKAAVVTSILPGIGCAVQAADSAQRGHVDVTHTALCFAEDALLVSGFWEIALVMQIGEKLGNWIKAENQRDKFWDMDLLAKKGAEGWLHNVKRLIDHLKGDEFIANATNQFSTYQILTLYQASQLTGDLHAAHKVLSENATMSNAQQDQGGNVNISAHVQPELKRQICSTMAESKYQLQMKLEAIALNHTAKLQAEFKNQFLDDWLKAATTPAPILGITLPDLPGNTKLIHENIDKARNTPLPLYENEVKAAIKEVVERLATPAPCQCVQGKKRGKCEFGDCQSLKPENHPKDAGGRVYATNVRDMEMAKRIRLSEGCLALFTTCQVPGSAGEMGRPLWCAEGK